MKWKDFCWGALVAWLLVGTFSHRATCATRVTQTPDEISKLNSECEKGQLASCTVLGIDYLDGHGVAKDESKARALLERAYGGNDARGCNNLGIIYAGGLSVAKDEPRAVQLFTPISLPNCLDESPRTLWPCTASEYSATSGTSKENRNSPALVKDWRRSSGGPRRLYSGWRFAQNSLEVSTGTISKSIRSFQRLTQGFSDSACGASISWKQREPAESTQLE